MIREKELLGAPFTEFGVRASEIAIDKLKNIIVPEQMRDEIPTLNRMGYMKVFLDDYTNHFIKHAAKTKDLLLEIGCAYGFVVKEVLRNGGRIIASDLSKEHLEVLVKSTPQEHLENLNIYPASFPDELNLPMNSISAILASRIMHFLDGDEIERGLDKIHKWLKKDGKFYFVAVTPYHMSVREKFLSIYQARVKENVKWPGIIENQWEIAPMHRPYVEPFLNVFDKPLLEDLLPRHGFKIERIELFTYPHDTTGGEIGHVGLIATKV